MPDWGELLVDQLRFMARRDGGEVAYRDMGTGKALTFHEWDAASNALARGLDSRGVQKGDRASIYLPNDECLRWIVAYAAAHKAGAVAVPIGCNNRLCAVCAWRRSQKARSRIKRMYDRLNHPVKKPGAYQLRRPRSRPQAVWTCGGLSCRELWLGVH